MAKIEDYSGPICVLSILHSAVAGEILTLQRAAYVDEAAMYRDFRLPPLVETLDQLRAELDDHNVKVLGFRESGRLLGAVRLRHVGDVVELGRLAVVPDRQGQGIGTRLLGEAEKVFSKVREIRLFTGEQSTANMRLYIRCGYRECGRTLVEGYGIVHFVKTLQDMHGESAV